MIKWKEKELLAAMLAKEPREFSMRTFVKKVVAKRKEGKKGYETLFYDNIIIGLFMLRCTLQDDGNTVSRPFIDSDDDADAGLDDDTAGGLL